MDSLMLGVDLLFGILIGLTLGVLGGGGSIFTVPVLVYIAGQSPQASVTASLIIVGVNASMGAFFHRTQGTVQWRVALLFGGVGMVAAYAASGLSQRVSPTLLMTLFALLMLVIGGWMLLSKPPATQLRARRGWLSIALSGGTVGALTGFLGVGGGFLIVPALVMIVGLSMREAVGTSLVIIAMNSAAGLLGHLGGEMVDMPVIVSFAVAGILGSLLGTRLTRIIKPDQLRTAFAGLVVLLGLVLLIDNGRKLGWGTFSMNSSPWEMALLGGVLIGSAATLLLALTGRVAGISGLIAGALGGSLRGQGWRWLFLLGLPLGALIYEQWLAPHPTPRPAFAPVAMVLGGLLVGFGTQLGNGCTSGHGVCGLGRLSGRSFVAVLTFLTTGMLTVYLWRHGLGLG